MSFLEKKNEEKKEDYEYNNSQCFYSQSTVHDCTIKLGSFSFLLIFRICFQCHFLKICHGLNNINPNPSFSSFNLSIYAVLLFFRKKSARYIYIFLVMPWIASNITLIEIMSLENNTCPNPSFTSSIERDVSTVWI